MTTRPYQQLIVWQQAHKLCLKIYTITRSFPADERFRLIDQMSRSASSVPTNIAEGNAKRTDKEKRHFFAIALASLDELHYQLLLAKDLSYIFETEHAAIDEQIRSINFLLTRLRSSFSS